MKGIFKGFEPVDYVSKKTNKPVKGCTLYFLCKSSEVFGYVCKNEFISESSPIYKRAIVPLLGKFCDESSDVYDSDIIIDYEVTKRGTATFTDIVDLSFLIDGNPVEKPVEKAG